MPPAKNSTSRSSTFKEPAALKWLSSSLDTAQQALVELREDTGRDVSQGARDLHKDLRAFISSARRDAGKLAKALQRDFDQAQKQLAQGTGTAGEARAKTTTEPASRSKAAAKPKRVTAPGASNARAARSAEEKTATANPRTRTAATPTARPRPARVVVVSSSLPWSSISPGSLSLRRPNSSASRTPPDSTRSPVAFRTTGSCARAAPNYTQPPSVETVGIVAGLENGDLWEVRQRLREDRLSGVGWRVRV